jgi:hypothetical protein
MAQPVAGGKDGDILGLIDGDMLADGLTEADGLTDGDTLGEILGDIDAEGISSSHAPIT